MYGMKSSSFARLLLFLVAPLIGCNHLQARNQMDRGVEAYKGAHYEEAIQHLQRATELDPTLPMAKTYLATAMAQHVVHSQGTTDNVNMADQAITIFKEVIEKAPNDVNSMKYIADIYFSIKRLDDAKEWQKKVLTVDPKNSEAACNVGKIDSTEAYGNTLKALQTVGLNDDGEGNAKAPKKVLEVIKEENAPLVEEALQYLKQAIENRPNYTGAMDYLSLIYRRKAEIDYGNVSLVKEDVAQAEKWHNLTVPIEF
jgi:tetratricopeptide (TPR) repeat protein